MVGLRLPSWLQQWQRSSDSIRHSSRCKVTLRYIRLLQRYAALNYWSASVTILYIILQSVCNIGGMFHFDYTVQFSFVCCALGDDPTAQAINLLDLYCGDAEFHPSEGWALLTTESKQNRKIRYKSIRSHIHVALQYIQASGDAMDTASWSAVTKISYLTASGCKAGGFDTEEKISGENGFAQVLRAYQCIKLQGNSCMQL